MRIEIPILILLVIVALVANAMFEREPKKGSSPEGQSWPEFTNEMSGPTETNLQRIKLRLYPIGELR